MIAFLERALAWLARHGVSVPRAMIDDGSAHRPKLFATALRTAGAGRVRTRPWPPRTNGEAERFIHASSRTPAPANGSMAVPHARSDDRAKAIQPRTDSDNLARRRPAIKGIPPPGGG